MGLRPAVDRRSERNPAKKGEKGGNLHLQVLRVLSGLEADPSLVSYTGIHFGYHRVRSVVLTHSRATRDVTFFCSRMMPTALVLEETPLLLTATVLTTVQQVVKWVEPLSKRKQTVKALAGVSGMEGKPVTVRVGCPSRLAEYQEKLFKVLKYTEIPRSEADSNDRQSGGRVQFPDQC